MKLQDLKYHWEMDGEDANVYVCYQFKLFLSKRGNSFFMLFYACCIAPALMIDHFTQLFSPLPISQSSQIYIITVHTTEMVARLIIITTVAATKTSLPNIP
jgi:hypothetical protein